MNPVPNKTPVINLLVLFDIILKSNCITPSKINGISNNMHTILGINKLKANRRTEHIYPIKTPVQRAHKGN